jgi:hypothetical protein
VTVVDAVLARVHRLDPPVQRALAHVHAAAPVRTFEPAFDVQADGVDLALGVPLRWGIGFALPGTATFPSVPDRRICFRFGAGGSSVVVDVDHQVTTAYVMNEPHPGIATANSAAYLSAVFAVPT